MINKVPVFILWNASTRINIFLGTPESSEMSSSMFNRSLIVFLVTIFSINLFAVMDMQKIRSTAEV